MSTKTLVWAGLVIGSSVGGYIPVLFSQDLFSAWSIIASAVGGIVGIWLGYQLGENWLG